MDQQMLDVAYRVGRVFVSDIYAYYQDTYKGTLGKVQVEALDYLHIKKKTNIKELAERLNISKQHASKIAGKLVSLGYAAKMQDPADGRGCLYYLTDDGTQFVCKHINQSNEYMEKYTRTLAPEEYSALREALQRAADILERCREES